MANWNRIQLIGRLTRDPETVSFPSGGTMVKFGIAVNDRKKNKDTGKYEETPIFFDCRVFNSNSETGKKSADIIAQYAHKGDEIFVEGRLTIDKWQDKKTGQERSAPSVMINDFQFLSKKNQGQTAGSDNQHQDMVNEPPTQIPAPAMDENIPF